MIAHICTNCCIFIFINKYINSEIGFCVFVADRCEKYLTVSLVVLNEIVTLRFSQI